MWLALSSGLHPGGRRLLRMLSSFDCKFGSESGSGYTLVRPIFGRWVICQRTRTVRLGYRSGRRGRRRRRRRQRRQQR